MSEVMEELDKEGKVFAGYSADGTPNYQETSFIDVPGELAAALAKAQSEYKSIKRTKKTTVPYPYSYAPLEEIIDATKDALSKNGLAITQLLTLVNGEVVLETILMHSSGQGLRSIYPLPKDIQAEKGFNAIQGMGKAITYLRKYSWCCACGVTAEDDTDARTQEKPKQAIAKQQAPKQPIAKQQAQEQLSPSLTSANNTYFGMIGNLFENDEQRRAWQKKTTGIASTRGWDAKNYQTAIVKVGEEDYTTKQIKAIKENLTFLDYSGIDDPKLVAKISKMFGEGINSIYDLRYLDVERVIEGLVVSIKKGSTK